MFLRGRSRHPATQVTLNGVVFDILVGSAQRVAEPSLACTGRLRPVSFGAAACRAVASRTGLRPTLTDEMAVFTSPEGRGRIASPDAIRVRDYGLSMDLNPSPGAPRRPLPMGEVKAAAPFLVQIFWL